MIGPTGRTATRIVHIDSMLTSGSIFLGVENGESGDEDEDAERRGIE